MFFLFSLLRFYPGPCLKVEELFENSVRVPYHKQWA